MRRLGRAVPILLLLGLAVGCGDGGSGTTTPDAGGPTSASSQSASNQSTSNQSTSNQSSAAVPEHSVVQILTVTQGGGRVSTTAVPVPDADAARGFAAQFGSSDLASEIVGAVDVALVPPGQALYAAVVSVGCSPPEAIEVGRSASGFTIEATGEKSPDVECFAPQTSVALVLIGS